MHLQSLDVQLEVLNVYLNELERTIPLMGGTGTAAVAVNATSKK